MSTIQETVDKAGYELGMIEAGASLDATDSADAMEALNDMMAMWEINDLDLNWFPQDTLAETLPVPKWAESGVVSNLALDLAAIFNIMPSQALVLKADKGKRAIGNRVIHSKLEGLDMSHIGSNIRWNIETGGY